MVLKGHRNHSLVHELNRYVRARYIPPVLPCISFSWSVLRTFHICVHTHYAALYGWSLRLSESFNMSWSNLSSQSYPFPPSLLPSSSPLFFPSPLRPLLPLPFFFICLLYPQSLLFLFFSWIFHLRYIPAAAAFGGMCIGLLTVLADFLGTLRYAPAIDYSFVDILSLSLPCVYLFSVGVDFFF